MRKSNLLLIFLMIFGSCECDKEPLEEVLHNPCYITNNGEVVELSEGSEKYKDVNVGVCQSGFTDRDSEGTLICVGDIRPQIEECNGLDDNCDGSIDDEYSGFPLHLPYYDSDNTCINLGVCRYSDQICVDGQWVCEYPPSYGPEVCDGRDNDCDGESDEDTYDDPLFDSSERYVYTGDPDTINVGECRAGYKECVDGHVSIRNMRTPIPEVCGNDDDDDCDGFIDEREDDNEASDIVFIIDYSGSMSNTIENVADALCSWSAQGVLVGSRFAVVAIGYVDNSTDWKQTKLLTDFTDAGTACSIIRSNNVMYHQGGSEYQLDAIYDSNSTTIPLTWSGNQKKVLVFTDEEMQYSYTSVLQDALNVVVQQCLEEQYMIGAFIQYNDANQADWVTLTQQCGGFLDYLSNNPLDMVESMNYWIGTDC
jgi:hypothetical protein